MKRCLSFQRKGRRPTEHLPKELYGYCLTWKSSATTSGHAKGVPATAPPTSRKEVALTVADVQIPMSVLRESAHLTITDWARINTSPRSANL